MWGVTGGDKGGGGGGVCFVVGDTSESGEIFSAYFWPLPSAS